MNHIPEANARAFVDGTLDEVETTALRAHVASCAACADLLTQAAGLEHATWELRQAVEFCSRCGRPLALEHTAALCAACASVRPVGVRRLRPPHRRAGMGFAAAGVAAALVLAVWLPEQPASHTASPVKPLVPSHQAEAMVSPALPALAHAGRIPHDPFSPEHEAMLAGRDPFYPSVDIQDTVRRRRAQVASCEARNLPKPAPAQEVVVEVGMMLRYSVRPDGSTGEVTVVAEKPPPAELELCLTQVVSKWHFPAFSGQAFAAEVPLRMHIL